MQRTSPTRSEQSVPTPEYIAIPIPAPEAQATTTTFINNEFGFSFTYPSWWKQKTHYRNPDKPNDLYDHDLVFSAEFDDPEGGREILLWKCVNDRENGWYSNDVTPSECDSVLKEYDSGNPEPLAVPYPINIFIRVFKTDKPLSDWLVTTYRLEHTELENYHIGKEIDLAGENGFLSSIGCCMSIDNSYVVKRGPYIYEFGSNAASSTDLIESTKEGFRFLDNGPTPDPVARDALKEKQQCENSSKKECVPDFIIENNTLTCGWVPSDVGAGKFIEPTGGETYLSGETRKISWQMVGLKYFRFVYNIELLDSKGNLVGTINQANWQKNPGNFSINWDFKIVMNDMNSEHPSFVQGGTYKLRFKYSHECSPLILYFDSDNFQIQATTPETNGTGQT